MRKFLQFILPFICLSSASGQNSLLWEISGNGLSDTSFLYGTMHTADKRVYDFKKNVMTAFNKVETVALELNLDSVNKMEVLQGLMMDSLSLTDLLDSTEYEMIDTYFQDSLGMSLMMFNKLQPFYTSSLVGIKDLGSEMDQALDEFFFSTAKEQGKKVVGLEKMEEQIGAFKSIPLDKQTEFLLSSVESAMNGDNTKGHEQMDELLEYYVQGDVEAMAKATMDIDTSDTNFSEAFNQRFLLDRNHVMADRSEPLIIGGSTFIAVGAAHLGGEEGLINLLRSRGYTVQPK